MANTTDSHSPVSITSAGAPRAWGGLAVLTLPCLVVAMDAHVLTLALPALSADLDASGVQLLWISDIYVFLVAGFLIPMGGLADRVGRRRLLLGGCATFAAASLAAAWAPGAPWLIAARGVQGIAGATLMPSTLALIRDLFPDPRRRTTALSVWGASFAVGGMIGPLVAGALLSRYWWGSVLLVAVPIMAAVVVVGPAVLPRDLAARSAGSRSLDVPGAALCLVSVLALVFALKGVTQGRADPLPAAAGAVGLLAAVLAVRHLRTVPEPLVDLGIFRRPAFVVPFAANACGFFVLYGTGVAVAQYLQLVAGLSPLTAGALTLPSSLAFLLGSAVAPAAARHLRVEALLGCGLATAAAGFALVALAPRAGGPVLIVVGTTLFAVGLAPVYVTATQAAVDAVPSSASGSASGLSETGAELGGALGIAVLGSLLLAVYRAELAHSPSAPGSGISDTLGAALAASKTMPSDTGTALADSARDAFSVAFAVSEAAGALLLVLVAIAVLVRRRSRAGGPGEFSKLAPGSRPNLPAADDEPDGEDELAEEGVPARRAAAAPRRQ